MCLRRAASVRDSVVSVSHQTAALGLLQAIGRWTLIVGEYAARHGWGKRQSSGCFGSRRYEETNALVPDLKLEERKRWVFTCNICAIRYQSYHIHLVGVWLLFFSPATNGTYWRNI